MKKLDDLKVVLGQMIRVQNVEKSNTPKKFPGASEKYVALQVENLDGEGERCLLFTEIEMADIEKVALPECMMKGMVYGRLYPVVINRRATYLMRIKNLSKREHVIRVSRGQLYRADQRALKHPLSVTIKSKLTDLFD